MFVHVVKAGESLFSIAKLYGGTAEHIRSANELNGDRLVPGMSLLIPAGPKSTLKLHIIKEGDTLDTLSMETGIPPHIILAVNDKLDDRKWIPGESLWIPSRVRPDKTIQVNAFMIPSGKQTDTEIIEDAADCLTYVSLFNSRVYPDGTLSEMPDEAVVLSLKREKVAPLLTVTNFDGSRFNPDLARTVIKHPELKRRAVHNILRTVMEKRYAGINIDFEHLYPEDREPFTAFVRGLADEAKLQNVPLTVTMGPKMSDDPRNPWMGAFDYRALGQMADQVILMTFEWGWVGGPPMAVAPLNMVRSVLDYATSQIPPDKIMMGMSLYGYNWPIPYEKGNRAAGISPKAAVEQAIRTEVHIHFHKESASPMFTYRGSRNEMRQIWFEDARSILAKFHLVDVMGLRGISYWMLGHPFPQNWTLLHSTFHIAKRNFHLS
ncbi:glycoside hydrolase family 18 protein [Effusibacillus lacus]|uniref:Glycoside hydrolase n=1 Tax=Effusibacillus lacus TaxID=1348429 RepID=A0A292YL86_9BACL|nr:glycosyl hydrolase family 18 protein [Effusibacillus lacus]TCS72855.1 spore germination protein [Effusibacillus lacus]GAX89220.1 glycoside hydrolase [Effusibacillus lacus]